MTNRRSQEVIGYIPVDLPDDPQASFTDVAGNLHLDEGTKQDMVQMGALPIWFPYVAIPFITGTGFMLYKLLKPKEVGPSIPSGMSAPEPSPYEGGGGGGGGGGYSPSVGPTAVPVGPITPATLTAMNVDRGAQGLPPVPVVNTTGSPVGPIGPTTNRPTIMTPGQPIGTIARGLGNVLANMTTPIAPTTSVTPAGGLDAMTNAELMARRTVLMREKSTAPTVAVRNEMQAELDKINRILLARQGGGPSVAQLAAESRGYGTMPVSVRPVTPTVATSRAPVSSPPSSTTRASPNTATASASFNTRIHGEPMVTTMTVIPMPQDMGYLTSFLNRLYLREPDAMLTFHELCMLAKEGNPNATFALSRLQSAFSQKQPYVPLSMGALPLALGAPIHWVTSMIAKALALSANVISGAGQWASKPVMYAAHAVSKV